MSFDKLAKRTPQLSEVLMTEIVLPQHTNAIGSVFGGTIVSWVDIAAAACAMRHARNQVVTASIDAMHFLAPVHLGWIVSLKARVNFTSRTSCEVGVRVEAENPLTNEFNHTATAFLTMVCVDEKGIPCSIPPLHVESKIDLGREEAAKIRRENRLSVKKELLKKRQQETT